MMLPFGPIDMLFPPHVVRVRPAGASPHEHVDVDDVNGDDVNRDDVDGEGKDGDGVVLRAASRQVGDDSVD